VPDILEGQARDGGQSTRRDRGFHASLQLHQANVLLDGCILRGTQERSPNAAPSGSVRHEHALQLGLAWFASHEAAAADGPLIHPGDEERCLKRQKGSDANAVAALRRVEGGRAVIRLLPQQPHTRLIRRFQPDRDANQALGPGLLGSAAVRQARC